MKLIESKTYLNLAKSYAGETQAHTRYKFIEYGARQEGYEAMANLIHMVAKNEFNHARMFYSYIQTALEKPIENIDICSGYPFKEKWNLVDNLKFAAEDEANEDEKIYRSYEQTAREEGFEDIANLYANIRKVENCHKMLFTQLYTGLKNGTLYKKDKATKWKCCGCGHEDNLKEAWEVCPLCRAEQGFVMLKINDEA